MHYYFVFLSMTHDWYLLNLLEYCFCTKLFALVSSTVMKYLHGSISSIHIKNHLLSISPSAQDSRILLIPKASLFSIKNNIKLIISLPLSLLQDLEQLFILGRSSSLDNLYMNDSLPFCAREKTELHLGNIFTIARPINDELKIYKKHVKSIRFFCNRDWLKQWFIQILIKICKWYQIIDLIQLKMLYT